MSLTSPPIQIGLALPQVTPTVNSFPHAYMTSAVQRIITVPVKATLFTQRKNAAINACQELPR
jgi:hypothetical protein